jgi:hypothetical protein
VRSDPYQFCPWFRWVASRELRLLKAYRGKASILDSRAIRGTLLREDHCYALKGPGVLSSYSLFFATSLSRIS